MKKFKVILNIVLYLAMVLGLFLLILRYVEPAAKEFYYDSITKNLVIDKNNIIDSSKTLSLGIYSPELPYHYDKVAEIEDSLNTKFRVISYYQAWGDGDEHEFNPDIARNIAKGGYVPMITWEPWVVAFDAYKNTMTDSSLTLISKGEFDYYIKYWAKEIVLYGKPIFLRLGHEMTNPWYSWSITYGNTPEIFIDMWKHVYDIFQKEGATNASFVWSPYTAYDSLYYPGQDYVDWIGIDIFNYGSLSESGAWLDFFTITKLYYDKYKHLDKPIMIAEVGCSEFGGNKNEWFRDMFHTLAVDNFPLIKLLVIFDNPVGKTPTGLDVDWSMTGDKKVYQLIKSQVNINEFNNMRK